MRKTMIVLVMMTAVPGLLLACGGKSGGGMDSPEAVAKALVEAAKAKDGAKVAAVFPTAAQMDAALTCAEGKGPFGEIARESKGLVDDMDEIASDVAEIVRVDAGEDMTIASGTERDGCTAKTDITVKEAKIVFKKPDGEEETEKATFIKLGDAGWYLTEL